MTDVTILTHDPRWKSLAPTAKRASEAVLEKHRRKSISLTILLTNDAQVRALNCDFRGKDKPTNVLSFPNGSLDDGVTYLGDIALAYETIAREAKEQGKTLKAHLTHLTIHGILHLMGYDHEAEKDAKRMETLEIKLLAAMGVANPYEAL